MVDVKEKVMEFNNDKAVRGENPIKLLKDCKFLFYVFSNCINESIEHSIEKGIFPDSLKEVTLLQSMNPKISLKNQITNLSASFPFSLKCDERLMFNQLSNHTKYFLSQILFGFRKAHST